jgi:S-adenosylmethionine hydrolase
MILSFTDFGWQGPYLGQMRAAALREAPAVTYVDLMADAPAFRPDLAAYLLASLVGQLARGDVMLAVVDPGVGTDRAPLALEADGIWLVGPDNGLFEIVQRRASVVRPHVIDWRPATLSSSFHGRDLFAPMAARIASRHTDGLLPAAPVRHPAWPDDLDRVVHIDGYGNIVTGRRAATLDTATSLAVGGESIRSARTFGDVQKGDLFWYANSSGLVEIAMNSGAAATRLDLAVGALLRLQHRSPRRK